MATLSLGSKEFISTVSSANEGKSPNIVLYDVSVITRPGVPVFFQGKVSLEELFIYLDSEDPQIRYVADRQRGESDIFDKNGKVIGTKRMIDNHRVEEMADKIFKKDRTFFGNTLTWNLPSGECEWQYDTARRILKIWGLPTIPDSFHRHSAAELVTRTVYEKSLDEFDPASWEFPINILTVDADEETDIFNESNNVGRPANKTRTNYLYQSDIHNKLASKIRKDCLICDYVEVVKNTVTRNSPRIITFNVLSKGLRESFPLLDEDTFEDTADFCVEYLDVLAKVRPELGPLPLHARQCVREELLIDSGAFWSSYLRLAGYLRGVTDWKNRLNFMAQRYEDKATSWAGDFFSRDNPLWRDEVLIKNAKTGNLTIMNRAESRKFIFDTLVAFSEAS